MLKTLKTPLNSFIGSETLAVMNPADRVTPGTETEVDISYMDTMTDCPWHPDSVRARNRTKERRSLAIFCMPDDGRCTHTSAKLGLPT